MTATARASLRSLGKAFDIDFARALAEPARVDLLLLLFRDGPSDISSLAAGLVQDRSVVSRHLKLLREAGLVAMSREGRNRIYQVEARAILARVEGLAKTLRTAMTCCCPEQLPNENL